MLILCTEGAEGEKFRKFTCQIVEGKRAHSLALYSSQDGKSGREKKKKEETAGVQSLGNSISFGILGVIIRPEDNCNSAYRGNEQSVDPK